MSLSGAQAAGKKRKAVCVKLLNKESYICYVDVKSKIQDVFKQVAMHLTLRETEYFGLAFLKDGEYHFISNDEKVYKHAPKLWKTNPGDGCDMHGLPLLTLYFRVQFYVDQVVLLREKVTRHLYYLQLKDNVLNYQQGCQEEKSFLIAGYALQADLGNYNTASRMGIEYFDPREYFPAWIVEKHGHTYLINNVPVVHRDLHGITRREAEWQYIKETSQSPSAHNLHFYRISKKKTDKIWNAWLGICARGIEIYEDLEDGFKDLISVFLWPDIGKLTFDKKKFEIRSVGSPAGRKFKYYTGSDVKSKYLLTLSRNTHMFQMAIQPKLMEIRHLEEEDKRRYRESYVHNDQRDLMTTSQQGTYRANVSSHTKPPMGNRYSVVSDASSTTTSGIVSDKMTVSFEENDDNNQEIMIIGPPLPTGMLLNTPSQARSKFVSTVPGYKPSPVPGANRSPILNHSELSNTFATQRVHVHASPNRLTNQTNISSLSVQSDRSGSGQSEAFSMESGSGGSYRKQLNQVPVHSSVYSPAKISPYVHVQSEMGAQEKTPLLAGRSACRKDSFKDILAQLQAHHSVSVLTTPQPHLLDTPQQQHVPSFHMEDLNYLDRSVSLSGSSDYRTNRSFGSDSSNQSSREVSISTVRSHDYENVVINPGSMGSFGSNTGIVPEAVDVLLPPTSFKDEAALNETHAEPSHTEPLSQLTDNEEAHELAADLLVSDHDGHVAAGGQADKKKVKPTHINVMNKKEVLLPEIEEIRDKSFALPFITALCNDKTLQPMYSRSGSITGSYDMSSLRSTDSYISRISHDTDIHRVSHFGLYPSSASGTLVNNSFNAHRPFSWHSESFDLDTQLANLTTGNQPFSDNYRSVPQDLYDFSFVPETSLWAHSLSYPVDGAQQLDRYSPGTEFNVSQLMIPPKLSSGGHNSSDANISHKSLLKENIGFA